MGVLFGMARGNLAFSSKLVGHGCCKANAREGTGQSLGYGREGGLGGDF